MREIKFRLWNPERKCITGGNHLLTIILTTDAEFVKDFNRCKMIFMQFTGLHDKNGKEIYEGDIVKMYSAYYSVEYVQHYGLFGICRPVGKLASYPFTDSEKCTVVGNIYENPELL